MVKLDPLFEERLTQFFYFFHQKPDFAVQQRDESDDPFERIQKAASLSSSLSLEDAHEAFFLFSLAREKLSSYGLNERACWELFWLHLLGFGGEADPEAALFYLQAAAEMGNARASALYGWVLTGTSSLLDGRPYLNKKGCAEDPFCQYLAALSESDDHERELHITRSVFNGNLFALWDVAAKFSSRALALKNARQIENCIEIWEGLLPGACPYLSKQMKRDFGLFLVKGAAIPPYFNERDWRRFGLSLLEKAGRGRSQSLFHLGRFIWGRGLPRRERSSESRFL